MVSRPALALHVPVGPVAELQHRLDLLSAVQADPAEAQYVSLGEDPGNLAVLGYEHPPDVLPAHHVYRFAQRTVFLYGDRVGCHDLARFGGRWVTAGRKNLPHEVAFRHDADGPLLTGDYYAPYVAFRHDLGRRRDGCSFLYRYQVLLGNLAHLDVEHIMRKSVPDYLNKTLHGSYEPVCLTESLTSVDPKWQTWTLS